MISIILLSLLFIPFVVKWKASEFLFSEKIYGVFLIWFSRLLTGFLVISSLYYWIGTHSYYAAIGFAGYFVYCVLQEKRLYFRYKKTAH